jgi:hypothetical protein
MPAVRVSVAGASSSARSMRFASSRDGAGRPQLLQFSFEF